MSAYEWQACGFDLLDDEADAGKSSRPLPAPGKKTLTMGLPARAPVQAKLAIDEPGSPTERAAEEAGAAVAGATRHRDDAQPAEAPARGAVGAVGAVGTGGETGPLAASPLAATLAPYAGGGHALPAEVRRPFEDAFATDLSSVQVHTDGGADHLNRSLGARAVTSSNHVFFGRGHYAPDSDDGRALLGHELAHVVQQQGHHDIVQCATDPDAVRTQRALPEFQFEGREDATVLDAMKRRDAQLGGVARDENLNNLDKRHFEDALATFVFNRWDLVGDVVLKVSGQVLKYIVEREQGAEEQILETMNKLREQPTTLGYPGFTPESADQGAMILKDQIPVSLPAHLNVHGKMSYVLLGGEQGDFNKGVAAKVLHRMGLPTDSAIDVLMPEALFGAPEKHTDDPERGRPRVKNTKDPRDKAKHVSGLEPRSEHQALKVAPVIQDRGTGTKRPTDSNQPHGRGGDAFFLDESKRWTQEARLLYDMPVMAGPSGSAALMMNTAIVMGLTGPELQLYTMALIGSIVGGGHHSFHEIMTVAAQVGVPYVPGDYLSVIPARFWQDAEFNQLVGRHFEDVSDFSRRTRDDDAKPKKEVAQDLQFGLPPIADDAGLLSLRRHLASRLPPEQRATAEDIGLVPINEGNQPTKGVSGAPVFTVTLRGKPIGVLKAFSDFGEMAQELSAMDELNQVGVSGLGAPQVMGIGKLVKGGKGGRLVKDGEVGLVLSTIAPGVPLDDLLENLGKAGKHERQKHFEAMCQAVTDVGLRLAALHMQPKGSGGQVGKAYIDEHAKKVLDYAGEATKSEWAAQQGLDVDLVELATPICQAFALDPGPSAMVHGDAHPGNFFHEAESGQVTAIDSPTMDMSIGAQDRPIGSPARDYVNFAIKLATVGESLQVTPTEIQALQEVFASAYHGKTSGATRSAKAEKFFAVRTLLSEVRTAIKDKDGKKFPLLIERLKALR